MNPAVGQHKILPFDVGTPLVALLAIVAVALWAALHRAVRRPAALPMRLALAATRVAAGFVAILCVMEWLQRGLVFATNWPLWPLALGGAVCVEVLLLLYAFERQIVSRRVGATLAALRVAIALLVVAMLAQPMRSVEFSRTLERYVAVLLDQSASMHVPDKQMNASEKTRLAEALSDDAPHRRVRLEEAGAALASVRGDLAEQVDWVASLHEAAPETRLEQLREHGDTAQDALVELEEQVIETAEAVSRALADAGKLDAATRAALETLRGDIAEKVGARLTEAAKMLDSDGLPQLGRDSGPLLALLRGASAALGKVEPKLQAAAVALDKAFYGALTDEERAKIDAFAHKKRLMLARSVLSHRPVKTPGSADTRPSLLEELTDRYGEAVRFYTFASKPSEVTLDEGLASTNGNGETDELPEELQETDLAAALEKVVTEMPADRLAGVVVLTDGRHNGPGAVEAMGRRLGLQQVPIASVLFGGAARPTTDAAVIALDAPETVYAKDKVYLNAEIKLDGLKGKDVRITLYDGDEPVDSDEIRVEADRLRTRIQLGDEPKDTGLHAYRVKIEEIEGEVLDENNEFPLSVSVTDDQTRFLVVAGRPRWEFRYLKNLFATRDKTVKLQYVLLHPDVIPDQKPRPKVHASAARAKEHAEATLPPENEAEWMKFDCIVLGDVEPDVLREEDIKAIKRFVEERAGTLIVIAGPRYMPHAYADTELADLLPAAVAPVDEPEPYLVTPEKSFRIALTSVGRESVITRLRVDRDENLGIWDSLPDIHWRHPTVSAKEGAVVLAYAMPPNPPEFLEAKREHEVPDEETILKRQQFERDQALIATHRVALGRVLFLSFDRTWRMRYRIGDTYHHRFWGQVLRWATSDKLPAGTSLVKVGTDRPRYDSHSPVKVRAKITDEDFSPVVDDKVYAAIYQGSDLKLRKKMDFVPNSQGMYSADLGVLPSGRYRFELDAPVARELMAKDNADKVTTDFFVETAVPAEQVELSADRGLVERLATLTSGIVVEPHRAADLLDVLGEPTLTLPQRSEWSLWDSWALLVLIVLLAGAEWLLRKHARLP